MKLWFDRFLKVIAVIAAVMVCWRAIYPVYSWHQKLTVTVETPDGPVTGSSVVAVEWSSSPKLLPDMPGAGHQFRGEATVVWLPGGRYLFALLPGSDFRALSVFAPDKMPKHSWAAIRAFLPAAARGSWSGGEIRTLTPDQYPLLVTFGDIDDPASVKLVDPADLEASFGPGYRLASITMAITNEAVTKGKVENVMEWLGPYPEPRLSPATGKASDIPFSRKVAQGDFIRR
ncbi:hypothetical protein HHL25_05830 [Rhizobium sp. S-51]|uniref:Uncharacterized protein n=1 Tax=Rhizobium terricola TaxID=2728849 RepID=A0A7Y0AUE3_9HYPH|nr:hypothetical protein [Rhizobium terricola]NML73644.1 hypothetical protein [Rhizobium terricola]